MSIQKPIKHHPQIKKLFEHKGVDTFLEFNTREEVDAFLEEIASWYGGKVEKYASQKYTVFKFPILGKRSKKAKRNGEYHHFVLAKVWSGCNEYGEFFRILFKPIDFKKLMQVKHLLPKDHLMK